MSQFEQFSSRLRTHQQPTNLSVADRMMRTFPLPRFLRIRRHPVTIFRTVLLVIFLALPAYLFLVLNVPGSHKINPELAAAGDVQYVGDDGDQPRRHVVAPKHVHVREANMETGVEHLNSNMKQGVVHRETLQVGAGQDQNNLEKKTNQTNPSSNSAWKLYDRINASYVGCFPDDILPQKRTLKGAFTSDLRKMTVEMCLQHCIRRNFQYAGLQFYSECYCGPTLEREKSNNESLCNLECTGNKDQTCGGAPYLSVYRLQNDPLRPPNMAAKQPAPRPGNDEGPVQGFQDGYRCCAERPADDSYFTKYFEESESMTVVSCLKICEKQSQPLAALFRGSQCHCGYLTHNYTLRNTAEASECEEPCRGDKATYCGGQSYYAIYQTGVEDTRCTEITMGKERQFPLVTLASFPGSGNTWVRYLLERATGIYTGSYYDDGDLYRKGFKGERENWRKGNTIAVKTHRFDEEHIASFDGAIVIVRNPYKAIISEHNRKFGGHTGFASEKHYTQGTEWIDFVAGKSRTWTNTAMNFLQFSKRVLVIHYEDLRHDMFEPLQKMVRFLGQPVDEDRILCTLTSPDGKFKRKESTRQKLSFDPYTGEMREVLGLYIKAVSMALKVKNQTTLPNEYNPYLTL